MSYLIDTNVISELRKGARCHPRVASWFKPIGAEEVFLSVLTIGELRRGIELLRQRDPHSAAALEEWLVDLLAGHQERILPVDHSVAELWGRFNVPDPLPVVDALLAATAKVHGLTLATRNLKDVQRTGVDCVNPFTHGLE